MDFYAPMWQKRDAGLIHPPSHQPPSESKAVFLCRERGEHMAGDVEMNINVDVFLKAMEKATDKALTIIAGKIENYAQDGVRDKVSDHPVRQIV